MNQAVNPDDTLAPKHGSTDFAAVGLPMLGRVVRPEKDDSDVFGRKSHPKETGNR
jgi:hypothetical protein